MNRFATFVLACAGLAGCVSQPGESVSASVDSPPASVAVALAENRAQVAILTAEPVTRIASTFEPPAVAPLPPKRPKFAETQVAEEDDDGETVVAATPSTPAPAIAAVAPAAIAAAPAAARAFAPPPQPQGEPLPIVRAAFTPGASARFDPVRRAYGYLPPGGGSEELLEMTPRPGSEKTTPRISMPGQRYYAAYTNTEMSCFPPQLREALNTIAQHYGSDVEVPSGLRHNGRRGSYHRRCMAADIRIPDVGPGELAAFARTIEGVNGVGTYRHNNVTHIDVRDYQMSWRH